MPVSEIEIWRVAAPFSVPTTPARENFAVPGELDRVRGSQQPLPVRPKPRRRGERFDRHAVARRRRRGEGDRSDLVDQFVGVEGGRDQIQLVSLNPAEVEDVVDALVENPDGGQRGLDQLRLSRREARIAHHIQGPEHAVQRRPASRGSSPRRSGTWPPPWPGLRPRRPRAHGPPRFASRCRARIRPRCRRSSR